MPIYAYRCSACQHEEDVLQKLGELLTECPSCHAATFQKQVTAAGFQLKGSGWYATDFKHNGAAKPSSKSEPASAAPATASETKTAASTAGGCGTGCACHAAA